VVALILTLVLLAAAANSYAQQPAQYSLYMMDPLRWNPAYAGLDHSLSVTGLYRKQWAGLDGSPTGQSLSAHLPIYATRGGFGLQVQNDALGANRRSSGQINYNYQWEVGEGILSLGAGLGLVQWRLDGNRLRTPQGRYDEPGVFDHEDAILPISTETGSLIALSAGAYYQSERFFAGASVDNLNSPSVAMGLYTYQLARAYYASAGMRLELNSNWSLEPSVWLRSDIVQTQTDISLLVRYNNTIFAGPSFRGYSRETADAVAAIVGLKVNEQLTVAYAYDIPLSALRSVHSGSHELGVQYNLNKRIGAGRLPGIIYHPRARR
jgi:type IX secretion system PorP/SprF family membrane protein